MTFDTILHEATSMLEAASRRFEHRLHAAGYERDDLLQEGRLALWLVARRFDSSRGIKLLTFARPRVHGAMRDLLRLRTGRKIPRDRLVEFVDCAAPAYVAEWQAAAAWTAHEATPRGRANARKRARRAALRASA